MAMSMGGVLAQGILGAVAGGAKAAASNALEEQKAEAERIREERLSKLRLQEYQARADIDLSMMPKKARVETEAAVAKEEAMRDPKLKTRRGESEIETEGIVNRARKAKELEGEFADQTAEIEGKKTRARAQAEEPFKAADDRRRGDEQIRVHTATAADARRNNWRVDEEGFYVDGDGNRVRRTERVEGRPVEVFVKAGDSKVKVRPEIYSVEDQVRQIDREILIAKRDGDREELERLQEDKRRLLSGKGAAATGKPWERKWKAD